MKSKKLPLKKVQQELSKIEAGLKAKAERSQSFKGWVTARWGQFETWVHSWYPGAKTKIVTALGSLGMIAGSLQQYITGLPLTQWISAETVTIAGAVLFSLAFWFKGLGERVEARAEELTD